MPSLSEEGAQLYPSLPGPPLRSRRQLRCVHTPVLSPTRLWFILPSRFSSLTSGTWWGDVGGFRGCGVSEHQSRLWSCRTDSESRTNPRFGFPSILCFLPKCRCRVSILRARPSGECAAVSTRGYLTGRRICACISLQSLLSFLLNCWVSHLISRNQVSLHHLGRGKPSKRRPSVLRGKSLPAACGRPP